MTKTVYTLLLILLTCSLFAKDEPKTTEDSLRLLTQNIEKTLRYEKGIITIGQNLAKVNIPTGFRFLDAQQSEYVVYELWHNPKAANEKLYGLIVPEKIGVTEPGSWAFVIEYDDMGYVSDTDADKINYDELLVEMQKDVKAENEQRLQMGYTSASLVGWAQKPFYDKNKKVLHWAKEISFADSDENTLNYNIRILGRKGVMVLNAVGGMSRLPEISNNIETIITSVEFQDGNRYTDFNPTIDKVAGWTIGGLVAGKVLAKAGIFAFLAKFAKIIFLGIIAAGGAIWRRITGRRKEEEEDIAIEEQAEDTDSDLVQEPVMETTTVAENSAKENTVVENASKE
jgi:uncharacterized membrane-anchored protein